MLLRTDILQSSKDTLVHWSEEVLAFQCLKVVRSVIYELSEIQIETIRANELLIKRRQIFVAGY